MRIKSGNVYKPLGAVSSTVDTKSSLAVAVICIVIIFIHQSHGGVNLCILCSPIWLSRLQYLE